MSGLVRLSLVLAKIAVEGESAGLSRRKPGLRVEKKIFVGLAGAAFYCVSASPLGVNR